MHVLDELSNSKVDHFLKNLIFRSHFERKSSQKNWVPVISEKKWLFKLAYIKIDQKQQDLIWLHTLGDFSKASKLENWQIKKWATLPDQCSKTLISRDSKEFANFCEALIFTDRPFQYNTTAIFDNRQMAITLSKFSTKYMPKTFPWKILSLVKNNTKFDANAK